MEWKGGKKRKWDTNKNGMGKWIGKEKGRGVKRKTTWDEAENKSDESGKKIERKRRMGK